MYIFQIKATCSNSVYRDTGRGKKNCVYDSMIPEWMDLVIWGHGKEK